MKQIKLKIITLSVATAFAMGANIAGAQLAKDEIKRTEDRIAADFKAAKQACDSRTGNAKDICMAEAKGNEKVAKAELDARDKGTPKARQDARNARAEADYEVAKERCDDLSGNAKDVCKKDAQAAFTKAKADAKLETATRENKDSGSAKQKDAQRQAADTKREADFKAARERCDSLAGDAKQSCVNQAKSQFGM